jgi:hypothetical protein
MKDCLIGLATGFGFAMFLFAMAVAGIAEG